MNRIQALFEKKDKEILNIYFTAGYPRLHDTLRIARALENSGVDLIELGMPYSDPLADGETIQLSSTKALANGMKLALLFDQIKELRKSSDIPLIMMGYYNQMMRYGPIKFLDACAEAGVDGLILPDLPMNIYEQDFKNDFEARDLAISFLIAPETSDERTRQADKLSSGFVYVVSKSSITGNQTAISQDQSAYFKRLASLGLSRPRLVGFGIHDHNTYAEACKNAQGAIVGSAFIRLLSHCSMASIEAEIASFVQELREPNV